MSYNRIGNTMKTFWIEFVTFFVLSVLYDAIVHKIDKTINMKTAKYFFTRCGVVGVVGLLFLKLTNLL